MNAREKGLVRGRRAGAAAGGIAEEMRTDFRAAKILYPTAADEDMAAEIRDYDRARLACEPGTTEFPELAGHADILRGEREGFKETSGLDDTAAAFRYSWHFYLSRRITSRHLARYDLLPPVHSCTNVFWPNGADGVTIADNRDDLLRPRYVRSIPRHRPAGLLTKDEVDWCQGGASSAVLLDDEPDCIFPANPLEYGLMPDDCFDDIDTMIDFMTRYRDFYGPGNMIWVDRKLNAVAVEKTNCLVAFRRPTAGGAIAITACAYLDDRLHEHQMARTRRAMAIKGDTDETSPDLNFHLGARERYRRFVDLTNAEAERGATLWGALETVADHAVPYPSRVCLAGETLFPDKERSTNWSLTQHAAVITGPRRRCLYRSVQDFSNPRPVYEETPRLMLGPGVAMQPDWQADVDAGRCVLTPPAE